MTEVGGGQVNHLEAAREAVAPVLDLLGIRRVVSVDDEHVLSQSNDKYNPDAVVAGLQSGSLPLSQLVTDSVLRDVFLDEDGEIVDIDEAVDRVRSGLPVEAQSRLVELTFLADSEDETPGQLDPDDVADVSSRPALEAIFEGHGYHAVTLAKWRALDIATLADGPPTLVLVDRDFSREGGATNAGDQVVTDLLRRGDLDGTWCCLLTHSAVTDADEERLEQEIAAANGLDTRSLVVLSKRQLDDDPQRFAIRLLGVLFRQHLSTLRNLLTDALAAGQAAAAELLAKTSDFQLLSMFAAAIKEGVHEPDHVLRPLRAVARRAMSNVVRPDDGTKHTLAPIHDALALNLRSTGLRTDDISEVQMLEMFDSSNFLAETVQPIEPGDIFQIVEAQQVLDGKFPTSKYHLILLAQPCDVMVRSNGKRGKNVPSHWALARVKSYDASEAGKPENVPLETFLDLKPRLVKLAEITHLPVIALDMCAFDPEGYSRLTVGAAPPLKASWSWTKRHEVLSELVMKIIDNARAANFSRLRPQSATLVAKALTGCLGAPEDVSEKQTASVAISVKDKRVAFGLRRVGRLNDAATRSLLVQATHHQGRPADEAALVSYLDQGNFATSRQ